MPTAKKSKKSPSKKSVKKVAAKSKAKSNGGSRFAPPGSKMEKAVLVMERMLKTKATRKEIIAKLISEAILTTGGAPTYFQLIRTRIAKERFVGMAEASLAQCLSPVTSSYEEPSPCDVFPVNLCSRGRGTGQETCRDHRLRSLKGFECRLVLGLELLPVLPNRHQVCARFAIAMDYNNEALPSTGPFNTRCLAQTIKSHAHSGRGDASSARIARGWQRSRSLTSRTVQPSASR